MIEETTIQQVRDRIEIVDLISHYGVELKRSGASYKACCPLHGERTPSFIVTPSRNTWHCFGCNEGGDGIAFVMKLNNLTFNEAIEEIANYYGIQIRHSKEPTDEQREKARNRESMLIAIDYVQKFYVSQFERATPEAEKARKYAFSRWGQNYCKDIGIGYAPTDWDALIDFAKQHSVDLQILKSLDIIRISEKTKKYYPLFRERITIPIRDRYGKIIAYTCRYVGDEPDVPKYMNSSDSELFHKGETVFALDVASRQAARNGRFIIVEGAPDVLRLHTDEIGLTETVAALGTAWTEAQFKQLKRSSHKLIFIPDADPPKGKTYGAGINAVMKNGLLAVSLDFDVSVRETPLADDGSKQDPDSFITSADAFKTLEDVHFALWYGTKVINACESDTDRTLAINDICRDVLRFVSDETLCTQLIASLSKVYGTVKLWRSALNRANKDAAIQEKQNELNSLPSDVAALRENGIAIMKGGYWSPNKQGDMVPWTNFVMQPIFHIIDGTNAIRTFRFKNDKGVIFELEFRQVELVNLIRFQQRVESLGEFWFKGNATNFQNLKSYLYSITPSAMQISKLGWNATERLYAFGDGIVKDGSFYPANNLGAVNVGDNTYYLPAFSKMHADDREAYQFERAFSCKQHGEINLYDFIDKMIVVFGNNAKMGFAFLLATLFLDVVKQTSKRLALLNIFGRKGSGKTELGTALMSFFIRQNDPPSLATTSIASLNDMLSCAENNLVHLDEYKNAIHFQKIELLKQIWGGTGQTKKNMDGDKKVQRTFVRSGVILTGQDKPNRDDALFSRVIYLQYSKTSFSREAKQRFDEFQQISARGVAHLTLELLKLRPVFETDYSAHYASCKRDLIGAFAEETIEDRVLNNWLAPLAAFRTAEHSLNLPFDYKDLLNFCVNGIRAQNDELCKKSDVAEFWSLLDANHMQGRIIDKAHFFIKYETSFKPAEKKVPEMNFESPKALLYLNFQSVVTSLVQRSATGGSIIGRLDPSSLESYLRTHESFLGTKQMRFRVLLPNGQPDVTYESKDGRTTKRVKEVRPKSLVFDYDFLREAYDLSLETVERDENEIPEEDLPPKPVFAKQQSINFNHHN